MTVQLLQAFKDTIETLWSCAWSSNGKLLGVSGADKIIRLYSLSKTGSFSLTNELKGAHTKSIRSISFCPRRARLSAASFDGTVSIWTGAGAVNDVSNLKWSCTATLEGHENEVKSCGWGVFLNDQAEEEQVFLATCGRDKTVWIWAMEKSVDGQDEDDFECLAVIQEHEQDIKCLAWHPSRPLFLTGSYDESVLAWGPLNSSLDDWIAVGKVVKDLDATVWTVSFSSDGKKLAAGLSNGKIILYNLPEDWKSFDDWTKNVIEIFSPIPIEEKEVFKRGCDDGEGCCSSSSEKNGGGCCNNENEEHEDSESESEEESGGCCGGGGKGKKMQVDSCCSSKKPRTTPTLCIPPAEIYSLAWNSSSRLIALACSDHSLRIVDTENGGRVIDVVEGAHEGEINCVTWSPGESDILASVGDDGGLKIWKIQ